MAYSLWLIPENVDQFQAIVEDLANQYGCKSFQAHMTLFALIKEEETSVADMIDATRKLASNNSKIVSTLNSFSTHEHISKYECIFSLVEPTSELVHLREETLSHFPGASTVIRFMPHISLLYNELSVELRKQICVDLASTYPDLLKSTLVFKKIELWNTDNACDTWKCIESCDLQ